jgi:hypothetical protein
MAIGEIPLVLKMIHNIHVPKSLILLDRGFGYFSIFKALTKKNVSFCIRITTTNSMFSKVALSNQSNDFIATWTPSDAEIRTCKNYGFDIEPILVRVSKIKLHSGEIEVLVSSLLDIKSITTKSIQELYDLRWGIEEGFKKLKPKIKLEQFGSRKPEGIYQEFYAHIFMMNLISIISNDSEEEIVNKTIHRKNEYKYNWQNAYRYVRRKIIQLFYFKDILNSLRLLSEEIAASLIPIKKGRQFVRDMDGKRRRAGYSPCYK